MKKKISVIALILTATVLLIILFIPYQLGAKLSPTPQPALAKVEIKPKPTLHPALVSICGCESGGNTGKPRQFNEDGTVVKGKVNSLDSGMCQINLKYHEARAISLGLDLFTEEGNIEYANLLYKEQGTAPWEASRSCWSKK